MKTTGKAIFYNGGTRRFDFYRLVVVVVQTYKAPLDLSYT